MVLLLSIALVLMFKHTSDFSTIVANEDGTTFRLAAGETLRTDAWTLRRLTLPDGSRVEMRSQSELALQDAGDGVRIRLAKGSVLVRAAKQAAGHLYVDTKDVEVSVTGTVFLVGAEEAGSRVAVIEGQVRVKQGAEAKDLVAGQELVTDPQMEPTFIASTKPVEPPVGIAQQQQTQLQPVQQKQAPQAPRRPQFDVTSVKRNNSGSQEKYFQGGTGRFTAVNMPLRFLMQLAYKVEEFQMIGAPGWIDSEHYDIEGTADGAASRSDMNGPMLQALIEDRFKAIVHGETRELPVYFLTLSRNGSKLTAGPCIKNVPNTPVPPSQRESACGYMGIGHGTLRSTGTEVRHLTDALSGILKRKVLDRTGLTGELDINLKWAPDPGVDPGPSIFTAIEEQLGLKLESGRAPIDVLVIDRIERPTEN